VSEAHAFHVEPVLPLDEIQGIAVPGFFKPHQTLIGVVCRDGARERMAFKQFLSQLAEDVSTGTATLNDRRRFKAVGLRAGVEAAATVLVGVGLTYRGLLKLTPGAVGIASEAFRLGLAQRSSLLGDPTDPAHEGNTSQWKVGGPENELDLLIVVAGDTRTAVNERAADIEGRVAGAGLIATYVEEGNVRDDLPGHEHFGFDDGVSQPGMRGRASDAADDFITNRYIAAKQQPERQLFGYPGQDLVWPGVLVIGHGGTSPDPIMPGPTAPYSPDWMRNGSFLVFRRLRQDVGLFWRTMRDEAARLAQLPGFSAMTDEVLASRVVGRWPSGAPVNRVPDADVPELGGEPLANNHIRFDSDASALPLESGYVDTFPQSKADPAGLTCPWASHIRKVNTRDSGSDMGGRDSTYARRLLRIGVPFGKPLADRYAEPDDDPDNGERGLLFLSIQASIEDQFEFLMSRWMNDPSRPKMPGGHDLLVGQNPAPGEGRTRRFCIFGSGLQEATVATSAKWIIPTGGGYFFVPSLSALREVLAG
jgi:Dyp-type peroxidase family